MPSATYKLITEAIRAEQQITCDYQGYCRELCPHILGHTNGEEKLLAFQFGGESGSALPPGGQWKCLTVSSMREVSAREGRWYAGNSHSKQQSCVAEVDLDINIHVRRLR